MRIMGIDYGDARIGIALSDPLGFTAQAYEVIHKSKVKDVFSRIAEIAQEEEVHLIVIGFPRNMNGTIGERAQKTEAFALRLREATGLPFEMFDERLSTVSAQRALIEGDVRREKRKNVVDKVAAALILQAYLETKGRS